MFYFLNSDSSSLFFHLQNGISSLSSLKEFHADNHVENRMGDTFAGVVERWESLGLSLNCILPLAFQLTSIHLGTSSTAALPLEQLGLFSSCKALKALCVSLRPLPTGMMAMGLSDEEVLKKNGEDFRSGLRSLPTGLHSLILSGPPNRVVGFPTVVFDDAALQCFSHLHDMKSLALSEGIELCLDISPVIGRFEPASPVLVSVERLLSTSLAPSVLQWAVLTAHAPHAGETERLLSLNVSRSNKDGGLEAVLLALSYLCQRYRTMDWGRGSVGYFELINRGNRAAAHPLLQIILDSWPGLLSHLELYLIGFYIDSRAVKQLLSLVEHIPSNPLSLTSSRCFVSLKNCSISPDVMAMSGDSSQESFSSWLHQSDALTPSLMVKFGEGCIWAGGKAAPPDSGVNMPSELFFRPLPSPALNGPSM